MVHVVSNFGAPLASVANNVANAVSIAAALTVD